METRMSQGMGMKDLIATLVVSGILLIVGVFVFAKVKGSISLTADSAGYNATQTIETTTYDAFTLSVVALIVLAAAVIIGILVRAFGA